MKAAALLCLLTSNLFNAGSVKGVDGGVRAHATVLLPVLLPGEVGDSDSAMKSAVVSAECSVDDEENVRGNVGDEGDSTRPCKASAFGEQRSRRSLEFADVGLRNNIPVGPVGDEGDVGVDGLAVEQLILSRPFGEPLAESF